MNKFLEIATKIGSQKYLIAIRDSFIAIMPITMVGSLAVLLNVFLRDIPRSSGNLSFVDAMTPIISINGNVWFGSLAIIALVFVFSLGYNVSKLNDVNPMAGGLVAFASLISCLPQSGEFSHTLSGVNVNSLSALSELGVSGLVEMNGNLGMNISNWGFINVNYLGSGGLFTALIIGLISSIVYANLMKKNIGFKLPDTVPPAVNKAFASIVPGVIAVYLIAALSYFVNKYTGSNISDLILKYIQYPLLGLSQGVVSVVICSIMIQLFWFFGIHGHNVLAPILDGVYLSATLANNEVYQLTHSTANLPYIWTRGSFDAYGQMGGSGITIALIVAIFFFSKKDEEKAVAKIAAPMGIFNINEPITYGIPIVLNPVYLIPWLIVPPICSIIAYVATVIGMIPPVFVPIPWITPPILSAYLSTGGSVMAALVALINLFVAFAIWAPFVIMANKSKD